MYYIVSKYRCLILSKYKLYVYFVFVYSWKIIVVLMERLVSFRELLGIFVDRWDMLNKF